MTGMAIVLLSLIAAQVVATFGLVWSVWRDLRRSDERSERWESRSLEVMHARCERAVDLLRDRDRESAVIVEMVLFPDRFPRTLREEMTDD